MPLAAPQCPTCKRPLQKSREGDWFCPGCTRRECPTCGRTMKRSGAGRYTCSLHGEWLEKEPDEEQVATPAVKPAADYDSDPDRHHKTVASQLREYGSGNSGSGRRRKRVVKRRPDKYLDV